MSADVTVRGLDRATGRDHTTSGGRPYASVQILSGESSVTLFLQNRTETQALIAATLDADRHLAPAEGGEQA